MSEDLSGIDLRIKRADQHLALLYEMRLALLNKDWSVVNNLDAKTGEYVFQLKVEAPDPAVGIILSEFAHMLRSSLDNLMWQLVCRRGGIPTMATAFPIFKDKPKVPRKPGRCSKCNRSTRDPWGSIAGVAAEDRAFIESFQPYDYGRDFARWHPLAMLAELNNVDKHRYMHAAYTAVTQVLHLPVGSVKIFASDPKRMALYASPRTPIRTKTADGWEPEPFQNAAVEGLLPQILVDGCEYAVEGFTWGGRDDDPAEILRIGGIQADAKVEMQASPSIDIAFGGREVPLSIFDLIDIRNVVVAVVNHFDPVFEIPDYTVVE